MAHLKTLSGPGLAALTLAGLLLLAGCAPSPLYFSNSNHRPGTGGEIPRDGRGEPIWAAIKPVAPYAAAPAPVAAPAPIAR